MQNLKLYVMMLTIVCAMSLPAFCASPTMGGDTLAKKHIAAGVTCKQCHTSGVPAKKTSEGKEFPRLATKEACLQCHGTYKEVAARTINFQKPFNPHYSHYGELNCYVCHRAHQTSEQFCTSCHMEMKVPVGWKAGKVPADE